MSYGSGKGMKHLTNAVLQMGDKYITDEYHYGDHGALAAGGIGLTRSIATSAGAKIVGMDSLGVKVLFSAAINGAALHYLRYEELGFEMRDGLAGGLMEAISCWLGNSNRGHLYSGDLAYTEDSNAEDFNGF